MTMFARIVTGVAMTLVLVVSTFGFVQGTASATPAVAPPPPQSGFTVSPGPADQFATIVDAPQANVPFTLELRDTYWDGDVVATCSGMLNYAGSALNFPCKLPDKSGPFVPFLTINGVTASGNLMSYVPEH